MHEKPAHTAEPIAELIARRWSPRAIAADHPVARRSLLALLEAARWAPSSGGEEPWRFVVWDREADAESWRRACDCLAASNREWAERAPVLLASFACLTTRKGKPNRWRDHDVGAATANLLLQATALGLCAHPMGGFDADMLLREFAVPEGFAPLAMIAVGHPGDPSLLSERNQARETAARTRAPLAERFFEGGWGRGFVP